MSVDKVKIIKPKRQISWVWQYFKEVTKEIILESEEGEDDEERQKETYLIMQCQVKETPSSAICGKEYIQKDAFTGNAISHLRLKHDITQTVEKSSKGTVLIMKRKNHSKQRQTELRQFLVDWVVLDSQPLSTVRSEAFWHFIHELDSAFIMLL
ncbi:hypothetical protein C1646_777915 [Rhizophagus diaphanus]|nr:hypothetical protein C1646_777915 [Rhizophagus diaphanus] [Rhizophagus sp. MUCL 43196]